MRVGVGEEQYQLVVVLHPYQRPVGLDMALSSLSRLPTPRPVPHLRVFIFPPMLLMRERMGETYFSGMVISKVLNVVVSSVIALVAVSMLSRLKLAITRI